MNKRPPVQTPNWIPAGELIALIFGDPDAQVWFQTFADGDNSTVIPKARYGHLSDEDIRKWLIEAARDGAGVFYCPNECGADGRRAKFTTAYLCNYLDLDGAPLPLEWPGGIEPDIIILSSDGRYHCYWLLERGTDLDAWRDVQAKIAAAHKGDTSMTKPNGVLRLPGFFHQKGRPQRVVIEERPAPGIPVTRRPLSEMAAAYAHITAVAPKKRTAIASDVTEYDRPEDIESARREIARLPKPEEGNRNNVGFRVAATCDDYALSREQAIELVTEWSESLSDPLDAGEIESLVDHALEYKGSPTGIKSRVDPVDDFADTDEIDPVAAEIECSDWPPAPKSTDLVPVEQRGLKLTKNDIANDTIANAYAAVIRAGLRPAWDELKQNAILLADPLPWDEAFGRVVNDHVLRIVRLYLVNKYQGVDYQPGENNLLAALLTMAYAAKFNPVLDYIDALRWDGKERAKNLFGHFFHCGDDEYTRAVSIAFMVGAVRRMRKPGCKFDTMPVIEGAQGWGKSTGVKALFGAEWTSDADLGNLRDKDAPMKLRGHWVQEFAEIESLTRAESGALKHFCSLQTDRQRDPYGRVVEAMPRRIVFVATVNEGGYLKDSTGARRFWPLKMLRAITTDDIPRDRDQLWAEAAALEAQGVPDVLPRKISAMAQERQADQTSDDPWGDTIRHWLEAREEVYSRHTDGVADVDGEPVPPPPDRVHTSELFDALFIKADAQTKDKAQRLRTVMEHKLKWHHNRNVRVQARVAAGYTRERLTVKVKR